MKAPDFLSIGKKAQDVYAKLCQGVCQQYQVNQTGLDVLMFLANHPNHNTARDLHLLRGIKTGLASVAVETLIQQGYLERRDDPEDRRIRRLVLTEKAQPLAEAGREAQVQFFSGLSEGIPHDEMECCRRTMEKLMANIDRMDKGGMSEC